MADTELISEIAGSLGAAPELLPFIPELLADLWSLGGSPERVVDFLRPLPLVPGDTKVVDLGCGKGATAVRLAAELGFRMFGVDGFSPFVETARKMAEEHGVSDMCRFECAELRQAIADSKNYDVAVYAAGGVLTPAECVKEIRRTVRPEGYMVIHDAFLKSGTSAAFPGYENYTTHAETMEMFLAFGDKLLRETVFSDAEIRDMNRKNTQHIRFRAAELSQKHPDKADLFAKYVKDQEGESEILDHTAGVAIWLIQKKRCER